MLKWKRGRILKAYGGNEYRYDGNGIRQEKRTAGGAVYKTIYELKPNNGRSIKAGVKQLKRYLKAYELEKETTIQLVLIVY